MVLPWSAHRVSVGCETPERSLKKAKRPRKYHTRLATKSISISFTFSDGERNYGPICYYGVELEDLTLSALPLVAKSIQLI